MITANLNDSVRFKLNDAGRKIYADWQAGFGGKAGPKKEDDEGYSRWQLWEVMQVFGPHMEMGFSLPFETAFFQIERQA